MKKVRILAVLVAIMMMATLAVAETVEDPAVVKVGDTEIGLSMAQTAFDYYFGLYLEDLAQTGQDYTQEHIDAALQETMAVLSEMAVIESKIAEYDVGEITAEDEAQVRVEAEEYFASLMAMYAEYLGASYEEVVQYFATQGYTQDYVYQMQLADLPYMRLYEKMTEDITISDEEIQAQYDTLVESQKALYENDIPSYESTLEYNSYYGGDPIYYTPEGYRYVKHILLAMPDDVSAELIDYETDMSAVQNVINTLDTEMYALENVDENAETKPRTAEQIQADLDEQQAKLDELLVAYEETREQILPSLGPIIDEINAKLEAGESFDALIEEYNTDPGMASNVNGYVLHKDSTGWNVEFRDAAMALEKAGDVSEPILTTFGVHIIQYADDMPGGSMEMTDELFDSLKENALIAKKNDAYQAIFDAWVAETDVETHPELIVLPDLAAAEDDAQPEADEATPAPTDAAK